MTALGLRTWIHRYELDRQLGEGADPRASRELGRRAQKLTSRRERHGLAVALGRAIRAAEDPPLISAAAPVDRAAVLGARELLMELAHDLETVDCAPPRAVALVECLLSDGDSPLYRSTRTNELKAELLRARAALLLP